MNIKQELNDKVCFSFDPANENGDSIFAGVFSKKDGYHVRISEKEKLAISQVIAEANKTLKNNFSEDHYVEKWRNPYAEPWISSENEVREVQGDVSKQRNQEAALGKECKKLIKALEERLKALDKEKKALGKECEHLWQLAEQLQVKLKTIEQIDLALDELVEEVCLTELDNDEQELF